MSFLKTTTITPCLSLYGAPPAEAVLAERITPISLPLITSLRTPARTPSMTGRQLQAQLKHFAKMLPSVPSAPISAVLDGALLLVVRDIFVGPTTDDPEGPWRYYLDCVWDEETAARNREEHLSTSLVSLHNILDMSDRIKGELDRTSRHMMEKHVKKSLVRGGVAR